MATKKPTVAKDLDHLDDLDNWNIDFTDNDQLPAVPGNKSDDVSADDDDEERLKLPDAPADQTRARANVNPDDRMRSWLNRIDHAQLDRQYGNEPAADVEPPPEQLRIPGPTRDQLPAVLSRGIRVGGRMEPQWHRVRNLPGFQNRNIRRMGDDIFAMLTRTPHGEIQTIAHVAGQGPNTLAEVNAVAAWLREHGRDLGQGNVDFGDIIPGYRPDVQNYSAMGVRFHLVRDPMGYYIYAWPESDSLAVQQQTPQLREGKENLMKLTESEKLWNTAIELQTGLWTQQLIESLLAESTLSRLIGGTPGGQALVAYLHKKHRLSNTADYTEHPLYTLDRKGQQKPSGERVQWRDFKWNPDYFMIIQGTQGVAGIKPFEEDIKRGQERAAKRGVDYDPAFDNTLRYQIVAFEKDRQIDPALLKSLGQQPGSEDDDAGDEPVSDPTVMRARGGLPSGKDTRNLNNIFDKLSTFIGRINAIYYARTARPEQRRSGEFKDFDIQVRGQEGPLRPGERRYKDLPAAKVKEPGPQQFGGAVEREKIAGRADARKPQEIAPEQAMGMVWSKMQPVFKKIVFQAISLINARAKRYIDGGDFENAQKFAGVGKNLKAMLADIDISGDITLDNQPRLRSVITRALADAGVSAAGLARGSAADYRDFLDALRARLMSGA